MALITEQQYRDRYIPKTSKTISSEEMQEALATAKAVLLGLVDAAAVTDAELPTPTNTARGAAIRSAHIKLTKRELLETRSSRFSDYGVMSASRDANGQLTNVYEKYSELQPERADLLAEALGILSLYLVSNAPEVLQDSDIFHSSIVPITTSVSGGFNW